tara:strand:+ start:239 stop:859 length:621 start_codon:yes stop_codon:yes gene_type:complete
MSKIILSKYQAKVFVSVEKVLQKRGNPHGIKANPKAYWLSKRMATYIMHNIAKSHHSKGGFDVDVENVYNWIFGILPLESPPIKPISNTGNTTAETPSTDPSILGFHGPWPSEGEAWHYPNPISSATLIAGATPPSLRTVEWRGGFMPSFWDTDNSELTIPIGFYKIVSKEGLLLDDFDTEWPGVEVFEVRLQGGIALKNQFVPLL